MVIYSRKLYREVQRNEAHAQKLIQRILRDTETLAARSESIEDWLARIGATITHTRYADEIERLAAAAARSAETTTTIAPGVQTELVKSLIEEDVKGYIAKLTDELKVNLREKFLEAYDTSKPPLELARDLTREVEGLASHRARTIARTETMRASNLSEYVRGVYVKGFQAYTVTSAEDCCEDCAEAYEHGGRVFRADDTDMMPPLHPNCRCTIVWVPLSETPPAWLEEPLVPNDLLDIIGGMI